MRDWLRFHEEYRDFCMLYFGLLYKPDIFLDQRFLGLFSSLEAYHKSATRSMPLVDEDSQALRTDAAIRDLICNELLKGRSYEQKWLKQKLQNVHLPSQVQRLKSMLDHAERWGVVKFRSQEERDRLIHIMTRTRGKATHGMPLSRVEAEVALALCQVFEFLAHAVFLRGTMLLDRFLPYMRYRWTEILESVHQALDGVESRPGSTT